MPEVEVKINGLDTTKIKLHGSNAEAEIDKNDIFPVTLDTGKRYKTAAWTTGPNHHLVAFDDAIEQWVKLI